VGVHRARTWLTPTPFARAVGEGWEGGVCRALNPLPILPRRAGQGAANSVLIIGGNK
jgi:hypothetical protein